MSGRLLVVGLVFVGACSTAATPVSTDAVSTVFEGFNGCEASMQSVIPFLERTLAAIDQIEPDDWTEYEESFDFGSLGLLNRAQEMHCTEVAYNERIMNLVDRFEPEGPLGEQLLAAVAERGLGSLDERQGGPIRLPSPSDD